MNAEMITKFAAEHRGLVFAAAGALFVMGAVRNWGWLCDPAGKPYSQRLGRSGRRVFFFAVGCVLVVCGVMLELRS